MNHQAAGIVIAGALIAVAIMLTNHWTLVPTQGGGALVDALLLNRWTGALWRATDLPRVFVSG